MRVHKNGYWDDPYTWEYNDMLNFSKEIDKLDKAHKRAKKELRKQQKAIAKKNHFLDAYKYMLERSQKREMELEIMNEALVNEIKRLTNQ